MGAGERESAQLLWPEPAVIAFGERTIAVCDDAEDIEGDPVTGNGVFDGAGQLEGFGAKTERRFGDFVDVGFTIDFEVRKFPEVRIDDASGSLANQEAGVSFDHESKETSRGGGGAARDVWKQVDDAFAMSDAAGFDRTVGTTRVLGSADQRTEFHE